MAPLNTGVNAATSLREAHHPVLYDFAGWEGECPAGFWPTFVGALVDGRFEGRAIHPGGAPEWVRGEFPPFDEEYFEWISLLQAIRGARGEFVMMELGAGYGRWSVNAALALRGTSQIPYRLIAVEAEPTHYQWLCQHARRNQLDPSRCDLIEAAVAAEEGTVSFEVGRPVEWYGQAIRSRGPLRRLYQFVKQRVLGRAAAEVRPTRSVSLRQLLAPLRHVDLIDADLQGVELAVFAAAREEMEQKVRRVHVGTHSASIERGLRRLFRTLDWECVYDFAGGGVRQTPFGRICFGDGVQTWVNPRLV